MSTDAAYVIKDVTDDLLERGSLTFTPTEREKLDLPPHTSDVSVRLDGSEVTAQWLGRDRRLHGEALHELLQDYATVGQRVRLVRSADVLDLQLSDVRNGWKAVEAAMPASRRKARAPDKARSLKRELRQRLHAERVKFKGRDEYRWHGRVGIHSGTQERFLEQMRSGGWDQEAFLRLRLEGERLAALDDFDELLAVDVCKVEPYPWQLAAARTVLTRMGGRGIFADEVGLGKTIEAGLVVKELVLRGLADDILVICPATLREQWRAEMDEKFGESFTVASNAATLGVALKERPRRVIMSIELARHNRMRLHALEWDLLVVDEAHRLTGAGAKVTRETIAGLEPRRMLFLSATPVQNRLDELYRLVELLRPGTFASLREFKGRFVSSDERRPSRPQELRELVSSVMVRTTRTQAGLDNVKRIATDHAVQLSGPEAKLYEFCTETLRHHMDGDGDVHRRRTLAARLVASPRALAKSALRMADAYPDPRVAEMLREIAHIGADLRHTSRSEKACGIVADWVREHGRVLVFSQHTDTVEGFMAALDARGIASVPFHGGMAVTARAKSVQAFRDGTAPVLVSTDAGAEGQNLQFCNCVLNYDLPWNPMRIEQRIGRVHRVTQTRDVHVANLFSAGTVDAHVYDLLHEKLAMFELLFGQVTTILGELDTRNGDQTFEGHVLDAYLSGSDAEMERRLSAYGERLRDARARALQSMDIERHTGIDEWVAGPDRFPHRIDIDEGGATELTPQQYEVRRERQQRVERFVRGFLDLIGAEIDYDTTGAGTEGSFLSARLPDTWASELDRDALHLAFDPAGLVHHPDSELCAAGTDVFLEVLEALRLEGDLHATVPVMGAAASSPLQAASDTVLVDRRFEQAGSWYAESTWLVRSNLPDQPERIETLTVGEAPAGGGSRRQLDDGEDLTHAVGDVAKVLAGVESVVADTFDEVADAYAERVAEGRRREVERIVTHYEARLAEVEARLDAARRNEPARYRWQEERDEYLSALANFRAQVDQVPDVDVRAEMLALRVDVGDDIDAIETWRNESGITATLRYPAASGVAGGVIGADAAPITVVSVCDGGHAVDASRRYRCGTCESHACMSCGVRVPCPLCSRLMCPDCAGGEFGICPVCAVWDRATGLDEPGRIGIRLGRGDVLLVGERHVVWRRTSGEETLLVPDADVGDPMRSRLRAFAENAGLPPDLGLCPEARPQDDLNLDGVCVWVDERSWVELHVREGGGATADAGSVAELPDAEAGSQVQGEGGIAQLMERLRRDLDIPSAPAVVPHRVEHREGVTIGRDGLVHFSEVRSPDGVRSSESTRAPWRLPSPEEATAWVSGWAVPPDVCRVATLDNTSVALVRLDRHVMLGTWRAGAPGRWEILREDPAVFERALLGKVMFGRDDVLMDVNRWTSPREVRTTRITGAQVTTTVTPVPVEATTPSIGAVRRAAEAFLPQMSPDALLPPSETRTLSGELVQGLIEIADSSPTARRSVTCDIGLEVSYDIVLPTVRTRRVVPVAPGVRDARLVSDVTGRPADDLVLDSEGHLAEQPRYCLYCVRAVCDVCVVGWAECLCCRMPMCGACAAKDGGLCAACAGAERVSRRVAKRLGADAGLRRRAVHGSDRFHEVVAVEADGGWTVHRTDAGERTVTHRIGTGEPATIRLNVIVGRS